MLRLLAHMLIHVDADVIIEDIQKIDGNKVHLFRDALHTEQDEDVLIQRAHQRLSAVLNNVAGQAK